MPDLDKTQERAAFSTAADAIGIPDNSNLAWKLWQAARSLPPLQVEEGSKPRALQTSAWVGGPSFWMIEKTTVGELPSYWDGGSSRSFTTDIDKAIHFCRREDAFWATRGWHWDDTKISEHVILDARQVAPETAEGLTDHQIIGLFEQSGVRFAYWHQSKSTLTAGSIDAKSIVKAVRAILAQQGPRNHE